MTPGVVVADGTAFVRLAVRVALMQAGVRVDAEVATAGEAARAALPEEVGALLLDGELEGALGVISELHAVRPELSIIVLSADQSDACAAAAIAAGACGFLPKDTPAERLPAIVRGAIAGEAAIPRAVVRRLLEGLRHERARGSAGIGMGLTAREREVLALLADGTRDREVAARLALSETTVRRHVATAMQKLGVRRRREAIDRYQEALGVAARAA